MRFGWFSTGRDEAARDLLNTVVQAMRQGEIGGEIGFVFCNREPGESRQTNLFCQLVQSYGFPLVCFSSTRFRRSRPPYEGRPQWVTRTGQWRTAYDREVMRRLAGFPVDLSVLAGYMLIVGEEMCRRYSMVNLHPATPGGPAGTWQEVIWKLIEARAETSGVMMHLVTPELDQGPPVTYCTYSLRGEPLDSLWKELESAGPPLVREKATPLFRAIRERGLAREFPLIVATLRAFGLGQVRLHEGKVVSAQGQVPPGYDLTAEIEAALRQPSRTNGP